MADESTILLIEEDEELAELLERSLANEGFRSAWRKLRPSEMTRGRIRVARGFRYLED